MTRRLYRAVHADPASSELDELIAYVQRDSAQNAVRVVEGVAKVVQRLRRYPRSGALDPGAPPVALPAEVRRIAVSGIVVRYAFPFRWKGDSEVVYIASIRRAGRLPEDDAAFLSRFLQEAAGIYDLQRVPA